MGSPGGPAEDQPEVGAGPVDPVQGSVRGDQRLPHGGEVLRVSLPPPHRLPGGCAAAGGQSAGTVAQRALLNQSVICVALFTCHRGLHI